MTIQRITACVQVKGDYQKCYHFYTEKVGLVPTYGDESGPYTSFASKKEEAPFFWYVPSGCRDRSNGGLSDFG
ncbi:hypothetical protein [Enterococcus casseliflavus]|uniref:hypothetical protein n=1 Tax=Enterococcus casseliflavus TaxID=37734 RepID=UPI0035DAAA8A